MIRKMNPDRTFMKAMPAVLVFMTGALLATVCMAETDPHSVTETSHRSAELATSASRGATCTVDNLFASGFEPI